MLTCAFLIPGDLDQLTGGYGYARRLLAALPARGIDIRAVRLPDGFPFPTAQDLAQVRSCLADVGGAAVLLIDGLAYGALPEELIAEIGQPIVALCTIRWPTRPDWMKHSSVPWQPVRWPRWPGRKPL